MKNNMVKETKSELKKVIWPTKKAVLNGTVVVAVMVVLVVAIILVFDLLSNALVKKLISRNEISITDLVGTEEHDHDHEHEDVVENSTDENEQTPVEENSEPTIDNSEVTE
jgi:preprotein translocase subunit SecE